MPLSQLENALTYDVRTFLTSHFSSDTIRKGSFISSLITCVVDASVVTFSIFTPQFIRYLHYDQIDINIIAAAMNIGLYLTLPALGYLSDAHGPILLALIGMVLCPGYLLAAYCYLSNSGYLLMSLAFFLIGTGTSSAYFCSLLTCAKIYSDRKGLSISLPVTCYGLSSLLLSYVFDLSIFRIDGEISIYKVFIFLSIIYLITGLLNSVSSVVVTIEKEVVFSKLIEEEIEAEREEYEEDEDRINGSFGRAAARVQSYASVDEATSLINSEFLEPQTHEARFKRFLRDPTMPLLYIGLFFLAGTQELFISNLGSLTETVGKVHEQNEISSQVALFSVFSTIARLSVGFLTDLFGTCRATLTMILMTVALCVVAYSLIAINYQEFAIVTGLMGLCYGSTFTLFPTLVAMVWGVDLMGSTWGLFLSAPAIGDLIFGLFYAYQYDSYCEVGKELNLGAYCLTFSFTSFTVLCLVSGVCLLYCYRRYWKATDRVSQT
ncbi:DEKNAAC104211 [Brettanomyces naardenensis]|uniref:Probable transporter MCH1 n=1 Tax=Brettanomyces naardenensis TaxID=13370 RepID=A0A448YQ66_BRENA|nr:DEKNAAC104211 [Brettanomyces naardenensis]